MESESDEEPAPVKTKVIKSHALEDLDEDLLVKLQEAARLNMRYRRSKKVKVVLKVKKISSRKRSKRI